MLGVGLDDFLDLSFADLLELAQAELEDFLLFPEN